MEYHLLITVVLNLAHVACISLRNDNRFLFDNPEESFGIRVASGFRLKERAICSATNGLIRNKNDLPKSGVERRRLVEDDDWKTTTLKSYVQTYRNIPVNPLQSLELINLYYYYYSLVLLFISGILL